MSTVGSYLQIGLLKTQRFHVIVLVSLLSLLALSRTSLLLYKSFLRRFEPTQPRLLYKHWAIWITLNIGMPVLYNLLYTTMLTSFKSRVETEKVSKVKQGSSENDGRSDVYDRLEFMVISNCCYNNCCRTNCVHVTCNYLYLHELT